MPTKKKIIKQATKEFNYSGFSATSLFGLAQSLGMSRGNLAYNFKDKDALLEAIAKQMWSKIETGRNKSRKFPSFENLHNEAAIR